MTENKMVGWNAERIFTRDFSDQHYRLTQQHIEALVAIYPAIEWDTRWSNKDAYTLDERQAFASELMYRLMNPVDCAEQEIDNCLEYPNNATFISYNPQNPHTEPDFVPDGYPSQPFFKFGSIIPESIPGWLEGFVSDWLTEMTGYEPDDVLSVINSFPIFADWQDLLTSGLPRITLSFSGKGIVQIRLLLVPFGGRALVSVDVEPDIGDILAGIFEGNVRSIELERDLSSIPLETDIDHIEEVVLTEDTEHTIYITFLPTVDNTLIPLKYGGGIRSVTLCGEFAFGTPPIECDIITLLDDEIFFEEEYIPQTFGNWYLETVEHNEELNELYDGTPQSVGEDIPAGAPSDRDKNALCYAIHSFVSLYASGKVCLIQSKNFLQITWDKLAEASNKVYNGLVDAMGFIYTPNLYSCFVDNEAAIEALTNESAIQDVACFLYQELKTVTMSQSNFDDAVLAAATELTDDAQKLACIMQNDMNTTLYINFLEAYNIALNRISDGDTLPDCPCETGDYRVIEYDFRTGTHGWEIVYVSGIAVGTYVAGEGFRGSTTATNVKTINVRKPHNPTHRVKGYVLEYTKINGHSSDASRIFFRPIPDSTSGQNNINPDLAHTGDEWTSCADSNLPTSYFDGFNQMLAAMNAQSVGADIYFRKATIWYMDGFAPDGTWLTDVDPPCT